jgi:recombination protein RecA
VGEALKKTIEGIEKEYGKGTINVGDFTLDIPVIPTGRIGIDALIGVGGIPQGRITEFFGTEGSGKSSLALHTIASAQKLGLTAALIDAEHALDATYASGLGINMDDLIVCQPSCGEQGLEVMERLIRSGEVGIIMVDSVDALTPESVIAGDMGDAHVATLPRLMGQALRKINHVVSMSRCCVIFINQIRAVINMGYGGGPSETTSGGRALKFYASLRVDMRVAAKITDKEGAHIGNRVKMKTIKNRVSSPYKELVADLIFGEGFSWSRSLVDTAVEMKIIEKSGAWFSYGEQRLGQGRDGVVAWLEENEDETIAIHHKILEMKGINVTTYKS